MKATSQVTTNKTKTVAKATRKPTARKTGATVAPAKGKSGKKATPAEEAPKPAQNAKGGREGSKTNAVVELLIRKEGVTLAEMMKATGWQKHSVRGFLSAVVGKNMGLALSSVKGEDGERRYSVKA